VATITGTGTAAAAALADAGSRFRLRSFRLHDRAIAKLALGLLSIAMVAWLAIDQSSGVSAADARVAAHWQVAAGAQAVLVGMLNQESGLGGYLGSGDPAALEAYASGRDRSADALARLHRQVSTTSEKADLSAMEAAAGAWQAWAEEQRARVAGSYPDQAATGRLLFERFQADESVLSTAASAEAQAEARAATSAHSGDPLRLMAAAAFAALALVLIVYLAHWQVLGPVRRLARTAAELAADLDAEVPYTDRRDEIGALAAALVDWRYSTAERLAVAKLAAESDARFRTVFDRAPIGIARVALNGRLLDANPTLKEMLGYEDDEMLRLSIADVVHRRDRDRLLALYEQRTDRFVMETRLLKPDGTIFWGLLTAALARMQDGGRPLFYVAMVEDINERKQQESELHHAVTHDALTGLANRRHFLSALETTLADRRHRSTAVFVIDLDGFKEVNDTLGHAAGDELLRQVASRMNDVMRNSDIVARLGGDEFAVLLPDTEREGADVAARKLLAAFRRPFHVEAKTVRVGASLGVSLAPQHGAETAVLVERADLAMYRAKRAGGGMEIAA
jgi:diguanylate cyclase (GGDEF)-like protein/PAS domain S-box-containing protein